MRKSVLLIILDGFGISKNSEGNAIKMANTPFLDKTFKDNPFAVLEASGLSVGLPENQMGNSEVGHTNIGAGRVVYQDFTYINKCITDGTFNSNPEINSVCDYVIKNNSALHLMGLLSDGGIHSHINHLFALINLAKRKNVPKIYIHAWLDGRDTNPKSALKYINALEKYISNDNTIRLATICGRYYAMDRDKNWERTIKAYNCMLNAKGNKITNIQTAIEKFYKENTTDEFIPPCVLQNYGGINEKDGIICFNFRPDRARQITKFFTEKTNLLKNTYSVLIKKYACMTEYDKNLKNASVIFKPRDIPNTLSEYLSMKNINQLKIAETEKYAHVTFFLNGGVEKPYKNEDRIIVNSPKVKTYDLKPEMSAWEITKKVIENIKKEKYGLIVVNYANPDMVGHTGNIEATKLAIEKIDNYVKNIIAEMEKTGGISIITADHGNAEKMLDENLNPFTAHTTKPVPFCLVGTNYKLKKSGALCDIAPTILEIMDIEKPSQMEGQSLIIN
ncbi:MAG: 2,3-bisphosphoglycerate-independent phosphoglycerate mutase [Clostridia bacterium]|nr:2,3-bisphosphoglycerate-independent phosphoglycerate mutase [Clostridia bacterium]